MKNTKTSQTICPSDFFSSDALHHIYQFKFNDTLQNALHDLRVMYEDIFVYGYRGMIDDYNVLSYEDRQEITCLYNSLVMLFAFFNKYDWQLDEVNVAAHEYDTLSKVLAELEACGQDYINWLDEMMIVSVLYKFRHCRDGAIAVFEDNERLHVNADIAKSIISSLMAKNHILEMAVHN